MIMSNKFDFRNLLNLFEARIPDVEYIEKSKGKKKPKDGDVPTKEIIARLKGYNSQSYTKLAQKLRKIEALELRIKQLSAETKEESRLLINDIFDAEDAAHTRVVETLKFIFVLSKVPEKTKSTSYASVINELTEQLTPELITVLEKLIETHTKYIQKSPSLKVSPIDESVGNKITQIITYLKDRVMQWGLSYDKKLDNLKQMVDLE